MMETFEGTDLIGELSSASGRIDAEFVRELEALMIKHKVNKVSVSWTRFDFLGDKYKEE